MEKGIMSQPATESGRSFLSVINIKPIETGDHDGYEQIPVTSMKGSTQISEMCSSLSVKEKMDIVFENNTINSAESEQAILHPTMADVNSLTQECFLYQCDDKSYKLAYSNPAPPSEERIQEKNKDSFVCDVENCGRQFSTTGYLKVHQLIHKPDKAHACNNDGCKHKYSWPSHQCHKLYRHKGKRSFTCGFLGCGKSFYTNQRLEIHKRTHTGVKPYSCSHEGCGKSFSTAGNLKNHSRIHTGLKPFVCEVDGCGKCFAELSSLKKHKVVHTGEKPFKCEVCSQKFSQSSSRNTHMKKAHGRSEVTTLVSAYEETATDATSNHTQGVLIISNTDTRLHMSDKVFTFTTLPVSLSVQEGEKNNQEFLASSSGENHPNSEAESVSSSANVVVLAEPDEMRSLVTSLHGNHEDLND